jgi:hypothetical protein
MAQQRPSFDMNRLSTGTKILAVAAIVFLIDSFLPWQHAGGCGSVLGQQFCASVSFSIFGGSGSWAGLLAFLLDLALIAWLAIRIFNVNLNLNVPAGRVTAGLAGGLLLFGLIKVIFTITNHSGFGTYIGIILLIAIAYGAYMVYSEPATGTAGPAAPPPPPAGGGGFTS